MEPPMVTSAEATDMLRLGRSGVDMLIPARQRKSIKIGRPQRASVASIRHVAAQGGALEAKTQGSRESPTPQDSEETGDVLADPLWTTADVAEFLSVPVQTIYDWRTRGYGPPGFRLGKHLRFRESDVFAWLDRMTRPVA
jgi:excisionase family DNA binding protein